MPAAPGVQRLCPAGDLVENELREATIEAGGRVQFLILARLAGRPRAWLNVCPHQGRSLNFAPDRFLRDPEGRLVCAAHGAVFELHGGRCISGPCMGAHLTEIPVFEDGPDLYVNVQHTSLFYEPQ